MNKQFEKKGYVQVKSKLMSFENMHHSITYKVMDDGHLHDENMDWKDNTNNATYNKDGMKWYADEDKIPEDLKIAMKSDIENVLKTLNIKGKITLLQPRIIIRERNSARQEWHTTNLNNCYFAIWPYHPFQDQDAKTSYDFNIIEVSI